MFLVPGFVLIRVFCHCVINVMSLDCILYKVNILLPEFDISKLWLLLTHWCSKYQGAKCPNLHGVPDGPGLYVE